MEYKVVRGMRDFYPDEMEKREYLFGVWEKVARKYGFEKYDAPVVESLELLERKAGEEITEQIYRFSDKSGRDLALRPEMTPSLARLVLSDKSLSMPIKWYSIAQCFRYERMSKGRKREHYQWNVDIIGIEEAYAEAEIISMAVEALSSLGLKSNEIKVKFNSRLIMEELFNDIGLNDNEIMAAFMVLDKKDKVSIKTLKKMLLDKGIKEESIKAIFDILNINTFEEVLDRVDTKGTRNVEQFLKYVKAYGISEYMEFDISIVRGLSYYTGIVFEVFDTRGKSRAILGGGRYNKLFSLLGEEYKPAVGFGFGDVVISNIISEYKLWPNFDNLLDVFIGTTNDSYYSEAIKMASTLRKHNIRTYLEGESLKMRNILSNASKKKARFAIVLDEREIVNKQVFIKDLKLSESNIISQEDLVAYIEEVININV